METAEFENMCIIRSGGEKWPKLGFELEEMARESDSDAPAVMDSRVGSATSFCLWRCFVTSSIILLR